MSRDKIQYPDPETGLPCLIRRVPSTGIFCGYVGVAPGHPLHGKSYNEAEDLAALAAHGGVNYADGCQTDGRPDAVCHVPGPGEPDNVWWFGFDTGHAWDLMPAYEARYRNRPGFPQMPADVMAETHYRDLGYMKAECAALAAQLAAM